MEKQPEMPKSTEQILAEKKENLTEAIDLMLNWQKSDKIKKNLFPQLDNLTIEEIDYCLKQVKHLDNEMQLRGPLSATDTINEALIEDEADLKEMEKIIGQERVEELKNLVE